MGGMTCISRTDVGVRGESLPRSRAVADANTAIRVSLARDTAFDGGSTPTDAHATSKISLGDMNRSAMM